MTHPPSVDKLAKSLQHHDLPAPLLVEVARQAIATNQVDSADNLASERQRRLLTRVINATGVLLHTNLGRAPFGFEFGEQYLNLELDLDTGKRGNRQTAVGELIATACGAESAMIVNNCAGATLLSLAALAGDKAVAVSRGEMVEIGGGFRVPEVMRQSGAQLVEVGTTNRTRLADFEAAINPPDAESDDSHQSSPVVMALKVHRSNYEIVGFTEEVSIDELASIKQQPGNQNVSIVADIGSGLLDSACPWLDGPPPSWLSKEPAAKQALSQGADLVLFSGDKLLGGPQAGIIAGNKKLVDRCAAHPLARALRPGSLVLSALQDLMIAYLERRGQDIPFWSMATVDVEKLESRCKDLATKLPATNDFKIEPTLTQATTGGGTLPTVGFDSYGLSFSHSATNSGGRSTGVTKKLIRLSDRLRNEPIPIIGRIEDNQLILDLRTVSPEDDGIVEAALVATLANFD